MIWVFSHVPVIKNPCRWRMPCSRRRGLVVMVTIITIPQWRRTTGTCTRLLELETHTPCLTYPVKIQSGWQRTICSCGSFSTNNTNTSVITNNNNNNQVPHHHPNRHPMSHGLVRCSNWSTLSLRLVCICRILILCTTAPFPPSFQHLMWTKDSRPMPVILFLGLFRKPFHGHMSL